MVSLGGFTRLSKCKCDGLWTFGGVIQSTVEFLLLDHELDRFGPVLQVEELGSTGGVYGDERLPIDPKIRSDIIGVFIPLP